MRSTHKIAQLIILGTGQSILLDAPSITVGRQDPVLGMYPDIDLQDKTVGRAHALIRVRNGSYTIEDLHTPNRTKLNDVILSAKQEYDLHDGDLLRFGSVEARFKR